MFDRRLRVLLWVFGIAGAALVVRLVELQVVRADEFRRRAADALILRPRHLPFVRGSILDRLGEVLVSEEPSWEVRIDYEALAADAEDEPSAVHRVVRRLKRDKHYPDAESDEAIERLFRDELEQMWAELAAWSSTFGPTIGSEAMRARAHETFHRVQRIRKRVADRRGFDSAVAEERMWHAVIDRLDMHRQIEAREHFTGYPWLRVVPASVRSIMPNAEPFAHILGRIGRVDAEAVADDVHADEPLARYRANETLGITGVEYAAEQTLRGRRGLLRKDRDGNVIDLVEPKNGRDVTLTLHSKLQRRLYDLLAEAVRSVPNSSGGCIVVLDAQRRDVLAMVSYPSYDPSRWNELYSTLRDDTVRMPLRFRAVSNAYAPGSIVKPLTCLAGLMSGKITLDTHMTCTGYLFPEQRDRWRCWTIAGTSQRMQHGSVDVVDALRGSCNIFMYHLGEQLGVDGMCNAFGMFRMGLKPGTGLREENRGINPTPSWMRTHDRSINRGSARLFAIGQAEVLMTPLQAANLVATYATGRIRPVTLIREDKPSPEWTLPMSAAHFQAVRSGVYQVVNDPRGTAYKYARLIDDRYALCGKTGSATAPRWPTAYRVPYLDAEGMPHITVVPAGAKRPAIKRVERANPKAMIDPSDVTIERRWPPEPPPPNDRYSHAWFVAWLQPLDASRRPDWSQTPRIAFAVLIEFGGSGGRVSGPVAKRVGEEILSVLGPDLDLDAMNVSP